MEDASIMNAAQLMEAIERLGFLPLLDGGIAGFSAEEMVDEECRYVFLPDGGWDWPLWKWKGPIITEGRCVYGKFFNKKAGFVSLKWWPDFCNMRRSLYPAPAEGSVEEAILLTLKEHDSLITRQLRAACGFTGAKMRSRFDAYITRLQWLAASSPRTLSIPVTATTASTAGDGRCSPHPNACWAPKPAIANARRNNRSSA